MWLMVKRSRTKSRQLKEDCGGVEEGLKANQLNHEMCPIHADFKHFHAKEAKEFRLRRKVSSIMCAKVLSIMRADARRVTLG
jgi:hypothetical protein